MADDDGSSYQYLRNASELAQRKKNDQERRLIALRNRMDFVSRNRLVSEATALKETRDISTINAPARIPVSEEIAQDPNMLKTVLTGGSTINPHPTLLTPKKSQGFSNPSAMIALMGGSVRQPRATPAPKKDMPEWLQKKIAAKKPPHRDRLDEYSSRLLGRQR